MDIASEVPATWPTTIREINNLPPPVKHAIYRCLIPDWIYETYHIDPATLTKDGQPVVHFNGPANSRALEVTLYHALHAPDPLMYTHLVDTFNNQLMVLLLVINDPEAPRFPIDRDAHGQPTVLGTRGRNIPAEIAALEAGLAPGQIRFGLRSLKYELPLFEDFVRRMHHDLFLIEPLSYHNAITFERYGFNYLSGRRTMEQIHEDFQPGGALHERLDGSTPFRQADAWRSVRGRSWAIHDGILGHPFTGFQMYKRLGVQSKVNTFPDSVW